MPCGATQDRRVMVESSDKMWSTGEGNGKPLQYSCLQNPRDSRKRQKDMTLKYEHPGSVGAQYATGDQWRNNSRKNEGKEPKQKQYPAVDLTFQVPMQYCSLQHQTLLLSPVTSTAGYCFCFGSIPSFFLELFLH